MGNHRGSATLRPSVNTPSGLRYAPPLGVGYAVGFDGSTARAHFEGYSAVARLSALPPPFSPPARGNPAVLRPSGGAVFGLFASGCYGAPPLGHGAVCSRLGGAPQARSPCPPSALRAPPPLRSAALRCPGAVCALAVRGGGAVAPWSVGRRFAPPVFRRVSLLGRLRRPASLPPKVARRAPAPPPNAHGGLKRRLLWPIAA